MITKLRASKVVIEIPREDSTPWMHITVQKVLKADNGEVLNVIPRFDYISCPLTDVITNEYTFSDPILQTGAIDISGAGVVAVLTAMVLDEMTKEYNVLPSVNGEILV